MTAPYTALQGEALRTMQAQSYGYSGNRHRLPQPFMKQRTTFIGRIFGFMR